MRMMNYGPTKQYMQDLSSTARETLSNIVHRVGSFLRPIYKSKAVRNGVLTLVYLGGSVNLLADNTSYEKQPDPKPNSPSKQTDANSGKGEKPKKSSTKNEKGKGGLDDLLNGIWHLPGNIGQGIDAYFKRAEKYGTVDDYLYRPLEPGEKRLDKIGEGTWFFTGHYIVTARNLVYGVCVELPTEAMARADAEKKAEQAKKPKKPKKERNREGLGVVLVPLDFLWDATGFVLEKGVDTLRFGKHVGAVAIEGAGNGIDYAIKNPANTAAMVGASYGINEAVQSISGGDGGAGEGGEVLPPKPAFPKPQLPPPPAF